MKRLLAIVILLLGCHLFEINCQASQLLGFWETGIVGQTPVINNYPRATNFYEGQFTPSSVFYYLNFSKGTDPNVDTTGPLFSTVGKPLRSRDTYVFEFNSLNTPDFIVFVEHLTSHSDEFMISNIGVIDRDGIIHKGPAGGSNNGGLKSTNFHSFTSFSSWQPEFVRLIVNNVVIEETANLDIDQYYFGYETASQLRWEIWGTVLPSENDLSP